MLFINYKAYTESCLPPDKALEIRTTFTISQPTSSCAEPWPQNRQSGVLEAAARTEHKPALPLPDRPSIAVLPFTNMSDDPQQDYFADGMVEEIITALSRLRWLFVIARNSSFTYKGRAVDVKQVGRELGVRYVLEGSVRRKPRAHHRAAYRCIDRSAHLGRALRRRHREYLRPTGSGHRERGGRNRAQDGASRDRAGRLKIWMPMTTTCKAGSGFTRQRKTPAMRRCSCSTRLSNSTPALPRRTAWPRGATLGGC
jgi:TolB-like protein